MKFKKKFVILILASLMIFSSCGRRTTLDNTSQLVEAVKQIETNQFKFMNFEIAYNDYIKNTQKYMFDYYIEDQEEEVIFIKDEKQYTVKDFEEMSLEDYKEMASETMEKLYGSLEFKYCSVNISDEYYSEDDENAIRYVYSKANIGIGEEDFTGYKKYTFLKDGDTWKVSAITKISESSEHKLDEITLKQFTNFGDSPVEYIETLEFIKDE